MNFERPYKHRLRDIDQDARADQRKRLWVPAVLLLLLAIWAARRPDQFLHPYVWAEEALIIETWQSGGFLEAAFTPIQGQFVLSSSLTSSLILSASFMDYPLLAYLAATCWFIGTALLWLLPGSRLPIELRIALSIAPALAPVGSETFGVLLYSFWWVTLWPVAVLFWDSPKWYLRMPVLLVAGLSSLTASALFIAFGFQWWVRRRREDLVSAVLLFFTFILQAVIYFTSDRGQEAAVSIKNIAQQMFVNIGEYPFVWLDTAQFHYLMFVGITAVLAALALVSHSRHGSPEFWTLWTLFLLVLGVFTVLSSIPAAKASEPIFAGGARYYFLPFIAVSWLAIALFTSPWKKATTVGVSILVAGSISLAPTFGTRTQEPLSWKTEVRNGCEDTVGGMEVPVHTDGVLSNAWSVSLDEATCSRFSE
jgi:hypothetical protein